MGNVIILGLGGVGSVVAHKCAQLNYIFTSITLAGKRSGVYNMEEFDPDPFMKDLNNYGFPWKVITYDKICIPNDLI